jgi:hypothetical protein
MFALSELLPALPYPRLQYGCLLGTVEKLGMNIPLAPFYILLSRNQTEKNQ